MHALQYGKTPVQILLCRTVQDGIAAISKPAHPERKNETLDILDFALTAEKMSRLYVLDRASPDDRQPREAGAC